MSEGDGKPTVGELDRANRLAKELLDELWEQESELISRTKGAQGDLRAALRSHLAQARSVFERRTPVHVRVDGDQLEEELRRRLGLPVELRPLVPPIAPVALVPPTLAPLPQPVLELEASPPSPVIEFELEWDLSSAPEPGPVPAPPPPPPLPAGRATPPDTGTGTATATDPGGLREVAEAPTAIGPYDILGEIGAGAAGVTYRGRHKLLQRNVAIKLLRHAATNQTRHARFLREAQALAALNHPHILVIHDCGEYQGRLYMALELVEGGSLADLVAQRGPDPLPVERAVKIGRGMLSGLAAAHAQGILHRDIKPANLLLAGDGTTVKIADFGVAKLEILDSITIDGATVGTPMYMAPEQFSLLDKSAQVDARSDIYAVGVVLYELLTLRSPYGAAEELSSLTELVVKKYESPKDPCELRREVSRELGQFVLKLMHARPDQRYQSAREALAALDALTRRPAPRTESGRMREPPTSAQGPGPRNESGRVREAPTSAQGPGPRTESGRLREAAPSRPREPGRPTGRDADPSHRPRQEPTRPAPPGGARPPSGRPARPGPPTRPQPGPTAPPERKPLRVLLRGESTKHEFQLPPGRSTVLGRSAQRADVCIPDHRISNVHCELLLNEKGELWVRDRESANGTYINQERVTERTRVWDGDKLQVATSSFTLECPSLGRRPARDLRCTRCGGDVRPGSIVEGTSVVIGGALVCAKCNLGASIEEHMLKEGFRIEERIGSTGLNPIYRARREDRPEPAVVSVLDLGVAPELRAAFLNDASMLQRVRHPALSPIVGIKATPRVAFAIFEPVVGETLEEHVDRRGPLEIATALQLLWSVTTACELAEGQGVHHRNLSSSAVLLTPAGDVKLTSFQLGGGAAPGGRRPAPEVLRYVAPERLRNRAAEPARCDAYSLGAILCYAVTGQPPHAHLADDVLLRTTSEGKLGSGAPKLTRTGLIPVEKLEELLRRLLSPDPAARPATMRETAQVVDRAIKDTLMPGYRGTVESLFTYVTAFVSEQEGSSTGVFGRKEKPQGSIGGGFDNKELLELLQTLGPANRSGTLRVKSREGEQGVLYIESGRIIGCEFGKAAGLWAAGRVAGLSGGEFEFVAELPEDVKREMQLPIADFISDMSGKPRDN